MINNRVDLAMSVCPYEMQHTNSRDKDAAQVFLPTLQRPLKRPQIPLNCRAHTFEGRVDIFHISICLVNFYRFAKKKLLPTLLNHF